jgi:polyhydroxyalkanoate synthesis regulator phasin
MMDKPHSNDALSTPATPSATPVAAGTVPRRGPGHRGADMRDTVAEMAERAQLISQEAGSKVAAAMKDVISAGAGIAGFAIESARDLVQYMVRRGQMTPEEADKLIREAEAAHDKRPASEKGRPTASKIAAERAAAAKAEAAARAAAQAAAMPPFRPIARPAVSPAVSSDGPKMKVGAKPVEKAAERASTKATAKAQKPTKSGHQAPKAPVKAAKAAKTQSSHKAAKPTKTTKSAAPAKAAKSAKKGGKR